MFGIAKNVCNERSLIWSYVILSPKYHAQGTIGEI